METTEITDDVQRLRALADSLGCATEDDLLLLTKWEPSTAKAKRKRGDGPPYILFGCRYLYPREPLRAYLHTLVRERRAVPAKGVL